jgi:hypothetical protein
MLSNALVLLMHGATLMLPRRPSENTFSISARPCSTAKRHRKDGMLDTKGPIHERVTPGVGVGVVRCALVNSRNCTPGCKCVSLLPADGTRNPVLSLRSRHCCHFERLYVKHISFGRRFIAMCVCLNIELQ